VLITGPFVSPYIDYRHLFTASYEGDSRLVMWGLAWDAHALVSGTPLFDSNIYHPEPGSLRFNEHFLGIALAALPFQWIGGPVFAYWVVWLLSFPLNALAMYVLAWHTTRDRAAAFVAGLIYAFCFFRMHHAHGHLQLLWTWPLPLLPLAIHRWIELPSWGRALCVAALVVMQALASWYLAVLTAIVCLVSAAVCGFGRTLTRRHVVQGGLAAVVGGGFVVWLALPYLSLQPGGAGEAAGLSADLTGYLLPPLNTWVGQRLPTEWEPREIWGERTIYVGMTTLLLATIGLGKWGRSSFKEDTRAASGEASSLNDLRPHLAVLITGVFAFAVSFGPSTGGWSPYDLLSQLPGFSLLRAPARLALLVMMALALLAAIGVATIRPRLGRWRTAACVLLSAGILFESYVVNFPGGRPQPFPIPPAYAYLATLPAGAVLSLPAYRATPEAFRDSDYLYFSTAHWQPIVNGYGRQEPPQHAELMETVTRFPDARALERLRQIRVRYVVVNSERASELRPAIDAARSAPGVRQLGEFGSDVLFEIAQ
jgi:hypothetical protein